MRKRKKAYILFKDARVRARNKGLDFDLQPEDVILVKTCPILGLTLKHSTKRRTSNSFSLDRIDNTKGYHRDNILVISWRANFLKGDATIDELEQIVRFYKRYKNGKANTRRRPKSVLPVFKKAVLKGLQDLPAVGLHSRRKPKHRRKRGQLDLLVRGPTDASNRNKPKRKGRPSGNRVSAKRIRKVQRAARGHTGRNRTTQSEARVS